MDLTGGGGRTPLWASKFFRFHAVFERIWQNRVFMPTPPPPLPAPTPGGFTSHLGEILDPPLQGDQRGPVFSPEINIYVNKWYWEVALHETQRGNSNSAGELKL